MAHNNTQTSSTQNSFRAALAIAATALLLSACGGSGDDQVASGNTDDGAGNGGGEAVQISPAPAFLKRTCKPGETSPHLFCPTVSNS